MPRFCCRPQPVSEESNQRPGSRRSVNTLILALALATRQEHLATLYHPCYRYSQERREERAPSLRSGLWW